MLMSSFLNAAAILGALRTEMSQRGFDAYIIPYNGPHYSESTAPCEERIKAISGFTGSAARVIITDTEALLWTDGRYWLQAESQLDSDYWRLMRDGVDQTEAEWLKTTLTKGNVVGVDGQLYPKSTFEKMFTDLADGEIELKDDTNPVNIVDGIPDIGLQPCPTNDITALDETLAGMSVADKLTQVRAKMEAKNVELLLLSELEEIGWLFNLRGTDLPPMFYAYATIRRDNTATLVVQNVGLPYDAVLELENIGVTVESGVQGEDDYDYSEAELLFKTEVEKSDIASVWVSKYVNYRMASLVPVEGTSKKRLVVELSPVAMLKAIKNPTEIEGMKNANLRESAAIVAYLSWLETEIASGKTGITEISGREELDKIKELAAADPNQHFVASYGSISASGSNAAIIHYNPVEETESKINSSNVYLLDTMGQYQDGTTDISRTVHFGVATDRQKEMFTRVLKGLIRLGTSIFRNKTTGHQLDAFARNSLWEVKADYAHGTGHGIGHYGIIHEGPQGIGNYPKEDDSGLEAGMVMTNEPGYYEEGEYGIRLENVVLVKAADGSTDGQYLTFETISFVPIQQSLIDPTLLTDEEVMWINDYHTACREKLTEFLNRVTYLNSYKDSMVAYLERTTVPYAMSGAQTVLVSTFALLSTIVMQHFMSKLLI